MQRILVIQTAFIGDVILATPVLEKIHRHFPDAQLDFLLRKGNEGLLENHPFVHEVLVWDKSKSKYRNLISLIFSLRSRKYDLVVNLQRFLSTGFLTVFSGAKTTVGFDKNPLSFLFSHRLPHPIGDAKKSVHEVERNLSLIEKWTDNQFVPPRIYPSEQAFSKVFFPEKYICIAPAAVWFTKQYPFEKWLEFINKVGEDTSIFLLGGKQDRVFCEQLKQATAHPKVRNLAGELSFLESAALMKNARMNFVNDSGALHLASAMNAPVAAIFCSTVPAFGFTPLSDDAAILETEEKLSCRPCSLHGRKACPEGHFKCSNIPIERLVSRLSKKPSSVELTSY
ncbi:MAG: glycosyltransferase family 9 protein [Bacteroidota bacterium]